MGGGDDIGGIIGQFGEPVLVVRSVEFHPIVEGPDAATVAKVEFDTAVAHGTHVAGRCGVSCIRRNLHLHEHAGGILDIIVDGSGKLVAEETQVYTEVGLDGLLPLGVGVGKAGSLHTRVDAFRTVGTGTEDIVVVGVGIDGIEEVGQVVLTVDTPGGADLGDGDGGIVFEEGFILHIPAQREGREGTPLVVGAEVRGSIPAEGGLGKEALVKVVSDTAEIGKDAVRNGIPAAPTVTVAVALLAQGVVHADLPGIVREHEAAGRGSQIGRIGHIGRLAQHHIQGVAAEGLVINQRVFHLIAVVAVHGLGGRGAVVDLLDGGRIAVGIVGGCRGDAVQAVALGSQEILLRIAVTIDIGQVQRKGVAELEAVPDLQLGIEAGHNLVGAGVGVRAVQHGNGVGLLVVRTAVGNEVRLAFAVTDNIRITGRIEALVALFLGGIGINGIQRGHADGRTQRGGVLRVGGNAGALDMGEGNLVGEGELVQPVAFLGSIEKGNAHVLTQGHAVVVRLAETAADGTLSGEITA